jgi:general secretion pathway protein A
MTDFFEPARTNPEIGDTRTAETLDGTRTQDTSETRHRDHTRSEQLNRQDLSYWGLDCKPFDEKPDINVFFESKEHLEALNRFRYALLDHDPSLVLLLGPVGTGKTLTAAKFHQEIFHQGGFLTAFLKNAEIRTIDVLRSVIGQLSFVPATFLPQEKEPLLSILHSVVQQSERYGRERLVIFLDQSDELQDEDLRHLLDLIELVRTVKSDVHFLLLGQESIKGSLQRKPSLAHRISLCFTLRNFNWQETQRYIRYRLELAGAQRDLFQEDAYDHIYKMTRGNPREINRLCRLALDYGYSLSHPVIDSKDIHTVSKMLY